MARKKQEIQLQREIETQEEWEEVMAMEGLWVVDVYQEWCGPCLALVGNFRRLKNELGDNLLNFAIAKADTIDALEKYRGRCEPTFLFYAGGILTAYIHGANAPKVQRVITEQLAYEHKVLEGAAERKEVKDPVITRMQEIEAERLEEEAAKQLALAAKFEKSPDSIDARKTPGTVQPLGSVEKSVTVAIIKPDAIAQGKEEEIISLIKEQGIEILAQEAKEITQEEAEQLYAHLESENSYDDLIKFITSGPSCLLVLTIGLSGEAIIDYFKQLIGPKEVETAKEENPNCIRARFGEKGYQNAIHGSDSTEAAARELALFFPNFVVPTYLKKRLNIQRTLAIIKPEVYASPKKDEIISAIKQCDLKIMMMKEVHLTKEQAAEFYKEHEQYGFFDALVELMCSGPMLALGLVGDEAISVWREKLGPDNVDEAIEKAPKSFRARYTGPSGMNQFHGSSTEEAAAKEIAFFFPIEQTVAMIKPSAMAYKDEIIKYILDNGYKIATQAEIVVTLPLISVLYPNLGGMEYFDELTNFLMSGPSLFLILSREDAISGWRRDMGEADPLHAKEENPQSVRALFGTDIMNNAVHGSSNSEHAKQVMYAVFGEHLSFNEDGTLKGDEPGLDETAMVIEGERNELPPETDYEKSHEPQETQPELSDEHKPEENVATQESTEDDEKKEEENTNQEPQEVTDNDEPSVQQTDNDEPSVQQTDNDEPSVQQTDNDEPSVQQTDNDEPSVQQTDNDEPSVQQKDKDDSQAEISEQTTNEEKSSELPDQTVYSNEESQDVSDASKNDEPETDPLQNSGEEIAQVEDPNNSPANTENQLAEEEADPPTSDTQDANVDENKTETEESQQEKSQEEPSAPDLEVKESTMAE